MARKKKQDLKIAQSVDKILHISLDLIDPPNPPSRQSLREPDIDDLAKSIAKVGQLDPILLQIRGDRYEVIFGHRRLLATRRNKESTIKAQVVDWPDDKIEMAKLAENIDRASITPIEEAFQIQRLLEIHNLTQAQIAIRLGKSESWVSKRKKMLEFADDLKEALQTEQIDYSVAALLQRIPDNVDRRFYLQQTIYNGASHRVVKQWVETWELSRQHDQERDEYLPPPQTPINETQMLGKECHFCGIRHPFSNLKFITVDLQCLDLAIEALLEKHARTENPG